MKMASCDQSSNTDDGSALDTDDELIELDAVDETVKNAEKLFDQKEFSAAAGVISKALAILSETYGEGTPECADALYFYGKALYFHVIETAGTLGRCAAKYGIDSSAIKDKDEGDESVYYTRTDCQDSDEVSSVDEDLDLSHQVLSLAIKAYESSKQPDDKKKMDDAYLYLGHVHLECERPSEASDCFNIALEHKSKYLPSGHRELSELLYMRGVALQALGKYTEALEYTQKARSNMIEKLEQIKKSGSTNEESTQIEEEIADVDSKIEDLNSTIELAGRAKYEKMLKIPLFSASQSRKQIVIPEKVNDISNLIRKKDEPVSSRKKRPHEAESNLNPNDQISKKANNTV